MSQLIAYLTLKVALLSVSRNMIYHNIYQLYLFILIKISKLPRPPDTDSSTFTPTRTINLQIRCNVYFKRSEITFIW